MYPPLQIDAFATVDTQVMPLVALPLALCALRCARQSERASYSSMSNST